MGHSYTRNSNLKLGIPYVFLLNLVTLAGTSQDGTPSFANTGVLKLVAPSQTEDHSAKEGD